MSKTVKKAKVERFNHYKNARKTKQPLARRLSNGKKIQKVSLAQVELRGFVPGHDMDDWL